MTSLHAASALSGISTRGVSEDLLTRIFELQVFDRESGPPPGLPAVGRWLSINGIRAFGMAAGRWLLLLDDNVGEPEVKELLQQFQERCATAVELTSARVLLNLSVDQEVLERCCSLDLESIPVEGCTMTRFAACHTLLARQEEGWWLCVERPQARHVVAYIDCVMHGGESAKDG